MLTAHATLRYTLRRYRLVRRKDGSPLPTKGAESESGSNFGISARNKDVFDGTIGPLMAAGSSATPVFASKSKQSVSFDVKIGGLEASRGDYEKQSIPENGPSDSFKPESLQRLNTMSTADIENAVAAIEDARLNSINVLAGVAGVAELASAAKQSFSTGYSADVKARASKIPAKPTGPIVSDADDSTLMRIRTLIAPLDRKRRFEVLRELERELRVDEVGNDVAVTDSIEANAPFSQYLQDQMSSTLFPVLANAVGLFGHEIFCNHVFGEKFSEARCKTPTLTVSRGRVQVIAEMYDTAPESSKKQRNECLGLRFKVLTGTR